MELDLPIYYKNLFIIYIMISKNLIGCLCQISKYVYEPSSFFKSNYNVMPYKKEMTWLYELSKEPKLVESDIDCQCYLSVFNKKNILCAFRGTENARDWLTDANIIRVRMDLEGVEDNKRPLVHWGMLRQFRSVEDKITEYIDEQTKENSEIDTIIYTGHSLGGALATIATVNYGHKYKNLNHKCVSFGAPRCGNTSFKNYFNNVCDFSKRYVNYFDPIPSTPFSLRYTHVCKQDHIENDHLVVRDTEVVRFFWVLYYKFLNWLGWEYDPIDDHKIDLYYEHLNRIFEDETLI